MPIPFDVNNIIRCYTTEHMAELVAKDPALQGRLNAYEQQLQVEIRRNGGTGDVPIVPPPPIIPLP